jgi:hypothetical protein
VSRCVNQLDRRLIAQVPLHYHSYQAMFGKTHAFPPVRNGIRINTLHVILHVATLTTLVVLAALTVQTGWLKSE